MIRLCLFFIVFKEESKNRINYYKDQSFNLIFIGWGLFICMIMLRVFWVFWSGG